MMTDTLATAFPTDLNTAAWDAQIAAAATVPFPTPISIPDTDNIIAELSAYASAMNTPVPADQPTSHPPSPMSDDSVPTGLFRTAPTKRKLPLNTPPSKKARVMKTEPFATEPVTPCTRLRVDGAISSPSQSLCTEADDGSMPPTPAPEANLPLLSREQTARRRAFRMAALKRNRCRKEEGRVATVKAEPTTTRTDADGGSSAAASASQEPVDKKAARAIRNREAAMKSRVEAKQKVRKLQDENDSLAVKVKSLSEENEALSAQLKSLLQHTMGMPLAEGQDVKDIVSMFAPVAARG